MDQFEANALGLRYLWAKDKKRKHHWRATSLTGHMLIVKRILHTQQWRGNVHFMRMLVKVGDAATPVYKDKLDAMRHCEAMADLHDE